MSNPAWNEATIGADEILVRTTLTEFIRLRAVGSVSDRLAQLDAAITSQREKIAQLDAELATRNQAIQRLVAMKVGTWVGLALGELIA